VVYIVTKLIGWSLLLAAVGGLIGQILRDRWPVVALLMYVPLLPVGLAALGLDAIGRGRTLPRARFGLSAVGIVAAVVGLALGIGHAPPSAPGAPSISAITVLQWNLRWGGGGGGHDGEADRWGSLCDDVARHAPDIVILSESPSEKRLPPVSGMHLVVSQHARGSRYLYRMVVCSRWPVRLQSERAIPTGRAMRAIIAAPGGDVRVLVVDGESHPLLDRTPRLRAVAQILRDTAASGAPIDLVAGDVNAVGRSVGFDDMRAAGYTSIGTLGAWNATWPSICPLWDIDHAWVGNRWTVTGIERFTNLATDHRGQVFRINVR
jgi:vancomycin resistance protein VanJ